MLKPGSRRLAFWLLALAAGPLWARGPEFDSKDPVEWAVHRLKESPDGPRLKLWEPKERRPEPPRRADGTLRDPAAAFPDSRESDEVMRKARALLALDRRAPLEEKRRAFAAVAKAAERWARSWLGSPPEGLSRREAKAWVAALGLRMIDNPAVPRFNELVDKHLDDDVAAEVDYIRGWRPGRASWRIGKGDAPIAVTYNDGPRNSLAFEVTRIHEWVHVMDYGRLGEVDAQGRFVKSVPEEETGLFTESKAYALDFLLQQAFLPEDVEGLTLEEYLSSQFSDVAIYPWAKELWPAGLKTKAKNLIDRHWFDLKNTARRLRRTEVDYLRTLDP